MIEKVKNKPNRDLFSMSDSEVDIILKKYFKKVLADTHKKGIATTHSDGEFIYKIHPNGDKEIIGKDISDNEQ